MSTREKWSLKLPFLMVVFLLLMFTTLNFAHASIVYDNSDIAFPTDTSEYLSNEYGWGYASSTGSLIINQIDLPLVATSTGTTTDELSLLIVKCPSNYPNDCYNHDTYASVLASSTIRSYSSSTWSGITHFLFPSNITLDAIPNRYGFFLSVNGSTNDIPYYGRGKASTTAYMYSVNGTRADSYKLKATSTTNIDLTWDNGYYSPYSTLVKFMQFELGAGGEVPGCMDPVANNYNPSATVDNGLCDYTDLTTHIVSFTPEDNSTTTSPVTFTMHVYINSADIGSWYSIGMSLHNIDQNVFLLGAFSPSDISFLDNFQATTSGDFYYSTTTPIGEGNYRLEASIERSYLFGWVVNPFSSISEHLSHQFIVGSVENGFGGTFIGNVSQNSVDEINAIFASSTATSTTALAGSCNVLSGFDVFNCIAFLFTPGGPYLNETIKDLKDGVLTRVPWGYVTRIYNIWDSSATTTLPSYTTVIQIGPGETNTPATTSLSFNPGDMISGAGTLLDSIQDPIDHKTIRDVAGPVVQLILALEVLFLIISDIIGSHKRYVAGKESKNNKLS